MAKKEAANKDLLTAISIFLSIFFNILYNAVKQLKWDKKKILTGMGISGCVTPKLNHIKVAIKKSHDLQYNQFKVQIFVLRVCSCSE